MAEFGLVKEALGFKKISGMDSTNQNNGIRPFMLIELARLYKVDRRTFRKMLLPFKIEIGNRTGFYYSIRQVLKIFNLLGTPEGYERFEEK
jgi:hypothetical protein